MFYVVKISNRKEEYVMSTHNARIYGIILPIVFGLFIIVGCGSKNKSTNPVITHSAHFHEVSIANFAFTPDSLSIPLGDTVLWTNNQNVPHTVTSDTGTELAGSLPSGQTYQHIFATAGNHRYHCAIHPTMLGTVNVQ
jgi:plastocyanin